MRTKWTRGGRARGGVLVRRAEPPLPTTTRPHKRKEVRPARCTRSRPANRRTRHTGRTSFRRYALLCLLYYTKCPWTRSFFGRLTRRLLSTPSHFFPQNGVNFFAFIRWGFYLPHPSPAPLDPSRLLNCSLVRQNFSFSPQFSQVLHWTSHLLFNCRFLNGGPPLFHLTLCPWTRLHICSI